MNGKAVVFGYIVGLFVGALVMAKPLAQLIADIRYSWYEAIARIVDERIKLHKLHVQEA